MTKVDFLNELYYYLGDLPKSEKEEIIADFREHFREGLAAGKTEEQICRELGSPLECAKQYVGDAIKEKSIEPPKAKKHKSKWVWGLALAWNVFQAFISVPISISFLLVGILLPVAYAFIVPVIGSTAFLVFAIASTVTTLSFGILTLLWAIFEIKICLQMFNR